MACLLFLVAGRLSAWLYFKKKPGLTKTISSGIIDVCVFVAVFTTVSIIPVNGLAKSIYRPAQQSGANLKPGLLREVFQHFGKVSIMSEHTASSVGEDKFIIKPAPVLFMEQLTDNDKPNTPRSLWIGCILFLFLGFCSGYLIRHSMAFRRRKLARARWAAEGSAVGAVERHWAKLAQPTSPLMPQPEMQKTSGMSGNKLPAKEKTQEVAKSERENIQRVILPAIKNIQQAERPITEDAPQPKPVLVEWDVSEIKPQAKPAAILYFPNPNSDGNFKQIDGRTAFVEGASIYKFKLVSANEAQFEFCLQQSSVTMALSNRGQLILNVADELNEYISTTGQIIMHTYGVAGLEDKVWKVKTKAKIRYV